MAFLRLEIKIFVLPSLFSFLWNSLHQPFFSPHIFWVPRAPIHFTHPPAPTPNPNTNMAPGKEVIQILQHHKFLRKLASNYPWNLIFHHSPLLSSNRQCDTVNEHRFVSILTWCGILALPFPNFGTLSQVIFFLWTSIFTSEKWGKALITEGLKYINIWFKVI